MNTIGTNPRAAALTGFLFILPFAAMNVIVAKRVEPLFSTDPAWHPHESV